MLLVWTTTGTKKSEEKTRKENKKRIHDHSLQPLHLVYLTLDCDRDLDRECEDDDETSSLRRVASRRAAAIRGAIPAAVRRDTLCLGCLDRSWSLPLSRGRRNDRMSSTGRIERAVDRGADDS